MYWVETSVRSTQPVRAQRLDDARLVAGQLEVDVELDAANASPARWARPSSSVGAPARSCE